MHIYSPCAASISAYHRRLFPFHTDAILDIRFSVDGARLFACGADCGASSWNWRAPDAIEFGHDGHDGLDMNDDGSADTPAMNSAAFVTRQQQQAQVARENVAIRSVSQLGALDRLACACANGSVSLWDLDQRCVLLAELPPDRLWRADGIASAAGGGWTDPARAHTGGLACARFSPNGLLLATASADCTAKVWNATAFRRSTEAIEAARERQVRREANTTVLFEDAHDALNGDEAPLDNALAPVLLFTVRHDAPCQVRS